MAFANVKVDNRAIAAGSGTGFASYSNLLDNTSGGLPYQAIITKSAGTNVLVGWCVHNYAIASDCALGIAINDGTSDTACYVNYGYASIQARVPANGQIILSGLGAGTFTLTLRVRNPQAGGNAAWDGPAAGRAYISAMEVAAGLNVVCRNFSYGSNSFGGVVVGSYADVKTQDAVGGVPIAVTITKASAASGILVRGTFGYYGNNATTNQLGVNDGTTDYQIGSEETNTSAHNNIQGERLILVGAAAGSYTLTLRFKLGAGAIVSLIGQAATSLTAMEVDV